MSGVVGRGSSALLRKELSGQFAQHIGKMERIEAEVVQQRMSQSPTKERCNKLSEQFEQLVASFVQAKETCKHARVALLSPSYPALGSSS